MEGQFIFIDPVSSDLAKFIQITHLQIFSDFLCTQFYLFLSSINTICVFFWPRSAIQYLMEVTIAGVHVLFLILEKRVFTTNSLLNHENLH